MNIIIFPELKKYQKNFYRLKRAKYFICKMIILWKCIINKIKMKILFYILKKIKIISSKKIKKSI